MPSLPLPWGQGQSSKQGHLLFEHREKKGQGSSVQEGSITLAMSLQGNKVGYREGPHKSVSQRAGSRGEPA